MEDFLMKIGIATGLAIIFGLDREIKKKGIGLKTIVTITVASCLLAIISIEASYVYAEEQVRVMDPGRIPSYVISGIGFLGAGVILRRSNDAISGLTTAALVWSSAGLGISIGMGFQKEALIAGLIIIISVNFLPWLIKVFGPRKLRERKMKIKLIISGDCQNSKDDNITTKIIDQMKSNNIGIHHVRVKDLIDVDNRQMDITAFVDEKRYITDVYESVKSIKEVLRAEVEGL